MAESVSANVRSVSGASREVTLPFVIAAASLGTLIDWYDFYLYGSLAVFFSGLFFPPGNPKLALLASLATFATGFAVRPFGAVLFGRLGDLIGRKFTFMLTLLIMGSGTFLIGLMPSYQSIGILAPILLVTLRMLQGLALGGEYGGAAVYIAEHSPDGKRGLYTSWLQTTATIGIVMSLLVILFFRLYLGDANFKAYGWRFPFLLSIVLVAIAMYIRYKLEETPIFAQIKEQGRASSRPLVESFGSGRNWGLMLIALFGATAPEGVVWYTGQFYALYFMQTVMKLDYVTVYWIMVAALCLGSPFFILFGYLSDKVGRRLILNTGFFLAAVTFVPVFHLMRINANRPVILTLLVTYNVILVTLAYAPIAAYLVEVFPARIRYTSLSFPYHIGNGIFGGFVPLIATSLVFYTGNVYAGLAYPILVCVIGLIVSFLFMKEPTHQIRIWDEVKQAEVPAEAV